MQLVSIESSFSEHNFKIPKQATFKFVEGGNNACCRLYFKKIQEKNDYNAVLAFETTTQLVRNSLIYLCTRNSNLILYRSIEKRLIR
jgi:hypothetical protein